MGSGGASVPPPPPVSKEEQEFLRQQNLSLQDFRGLLSESRLQQQETQNILKNLSGLYTEQVTPGTPGRREVQFAGDDRLSKLREAAGSGGLRIDRDQGLRNLGLTDSFVNRFNSELVNSGIEAPASPPVSQWSGITTPGAALDILSAGNRPQSQISDMDRVAAQRAAFEKILAEAKADPTSAASYGLSTTVDIPGIAEKKEMKLNQEKVNELRGRLADYQAKLDDLQNKSLEAEGAGLKALEEQINQNIELQRETQKALLEEVRKGPSEFDQAQNRISILQAERLENALRGDLPVSEATKQRKRQEFDLLKEAAARRGIRIEGDTPETATSNSTAGVQTIGEFNRTYKLAEDAERRGEISAGAAENLARYGLTNSISSQGFNQAASLRGLSAAPGTTFTGSPGAQSLGFLQNAAAYSPASLLGGYTGLLGGYQSAMQPYTDQRLLGYQANLNQASLKSRNNPLGTVLGLVGTGVGAYFGGPAGAAVGGTLGSSIGSGFANA